MWIIQVHLQFTQGMSEPSRTMECTMLKGFVIMHNKSPEVKQMSHLYLYLD